MTWPIIEKEIESATIKFVDDPDKGKRIEFSFIPLSDEEILDYPIYEYYLANGQYEYIGEHCIVFTKVGTETRQETEQNEKKIY